MISAHSAEYPLVYALMADHGPIKVGCTTRPRSRISSFQTQSPNKIHLLALARGSTFLEGRIKSRWAQHAMWGEWFKPAPGVLQDVAALRDMGAPAFLSAVERALDSLGTATRIGAACGIADPVAIGGWWKNGIPPERAEAASKAAGALNFTDPPHDLGAELARCGVTLGPVLNWRRWAWGDSRKHATPTAKEAA